MSKTYCTACFCCCVHPTHQFVRRLFLLFCKWLRKLCSVWTRWFVYGLRWSATWAQNPLCRVQRDVLSGGPATSRPINIRLSDRVCGSCGDAGEHDTPRAGAVTARMTRMLFEKWLKWPYHCVSPNILPSSLLDYCSLTYTLVSF